MQNKNSKIENIDYRHMILKSILSKTKYDL